MPTPLNGRHVAQLPPSSSAIAMPRVWLYKPSTGAQAQAPSNLFTAALVVPPHALYLVKKGAEGREKPQGGTGAAGAPSELIRDKGGATRFLLHRGASLHCMTMDLTALGHPAPLASHLATHGTPNTPSSITFLITGMAPLSPFSY
jgi:hypothetical protein